MSSQESAMARIFDGKKATRGKVRFRMLSVMLYARLYVILVVVNYGTLLMNLLGLKMSDTFNDSWH